jgi:formate hydrogenlyase transcriptional activator
MQQVPERHSTADRNLGIDESSRRYRVLLHATDLAAHRQFPELLQELSKLLHELFDFNFLNYALRDDGADVMRVYMLDGGLTTPEIPLEFPVDESPGGWVWSHQKSLIIGDLRAEERFPEVLNLYADKGFRSLIVLPMTTARCRLGTLSFGSAQTSHCDSEIVYFLERLAGLVALALENALSLQMSLAKHANEKEEREVEELAATRLQLAQQGTDTFVKLRRERQQWETIVEIQSAIAASRLDLQQMFPAISRSLSVAIPHEAAFVALWDENDQSFAVCAASSEEFGARLQPKRLKVTGTLTSEVLARAISGRIVSRDELERESARFEHLRIPLSAGLVTWSVVPMRSPRGLVGVLFVGSSREDGFYESDLELLRPLASGIALLVENTEARTAVQMEKERLQVLLDISRTLTSTLDWKKLFCDISTCIRRLTARDYAYISLYEQASEAMRLHALDFPEDSEFIIADLRTPVLECPSGIAFRAGQTTVFDADALEKIDSEFTRKVLAEGITDVCCVPLVSRGRAIGTVGVASLKSQPFRDDEIELLQQAAPQIAIALDNSRAYAEISLLKDKLAKDKVYLEQEIRDSIAPGEIIGESPALENVLEQVKTVAPSGATVLVLGETGTGKELVADAIHKLSPRANFRFVKINCAAIPTGLLESELFGHEKGAFTSAVSPKMGRLELADKGTLFLDEVGEIPLELQPKLLRALQDHEFERLGGTKTIRVDVRLIAATNRDLAAAVSKHEFRADLYYRLHVFPIRVPPLRNRPGDIPLLVRYFVQKFARGMGKQIENIPEEAMRALERWHWPGNVRELANFIERSVILTEGKTLRVPTGELRSLSESSDETIPLSLAGIASAATLEQLEREYILEVLRQSGGVIAGSNGAAARLGMKRTTLQSKIQRLGILREEYGC